jgi:hypothetical protein
MTWEKLSINGLLALVVLLGAGAAVVLVGRLILRPSVVAGARVIVGSGRTSASLGSIEWVTATMLRSLRARRRVCLERDPQGGFEGG